MEAISIASLSPQRTPPSGAIHAVVALVWPYSSLSRQCALLLVDPDFRLRKKQGQVRIRFTGASAEAVATSHVGIGDKIVLALSGAAWALNVEEMQMPGCGVDGDLEYRGRLELKFTRPRDGIEVEVNINVQETRH